MAIQPAVYILTNKPSGTLYIGVTGNLVRRTWQHRKEHSRGFTQKYQLHRLVYFELHDSMEQAITREKRLKKWNRAWKLRLIEEMNPGWVDLWDRIVS